MAQQIVVSFCLTKSTILTDKLCSKIVVQFKWIAVRRCVDFWNFEFYEIFFAVFVM